jgi:hypothetical protein
MSIEGAQQHEGQPHMENTPYKQLAERLDALPNGFPPTEDGIELELLARLFTQEEAECASQLRMTPETPAQIAVRTGRTSATAAPARAGFCGV